MKVLPLFPLARLGPLALLVTIGLVVARFVVVSDELANDWVAVAFLPLTIYLGTCYVRARKRVLAESGREREIIQADLSAIAAQRTSKFWTLIFATAAVTTCALAASAWFYQFWLWYREDRWISVTVNALPQSLSWPDNIYLLRIVHWLGDTNLGAAIMIVGLLICAPLVAINHRSQEKAKRKRKELGNLKRRS